MCVLCVVAQWYMVPSVIKEGRTVSFYLIFFFCKGWRGSQTKYFLKNRGMHHLKEGDGVSLFSLQVYLNPSLQITDITASDIYISTYMDSEHINFEFTGTVFSQDTSEIFAILHHNFTNYGCLCWTLRFLPSFCLLPCNIIIRISSCLFLSF